MTAERGWFVVGGTFGVLFCGFGSLYAFGPFFAPLQAEFGASRGAVSLAFSIATCLLFLLGAPGRVAGKTVVDLGSGSGVAGIAAALAGADRVIASDTDPDARLATTTNAGVNGVRIDVTDTLPKVCDLLLKCNNFIQFFPLSKCWHRLDFK